MSTVEDREVGGSRANKRRVIVVGGVVAFVVATSFGIATVVGQDGQEPEVPEVVATEPATPEHEPSVPVSEEPEEVEATPEPEPTEEEEFATEHLTQSEAQAAFDEFYALVQELGIPEGTTNVSTVDFMGKGWELIASSQRTGAAHGDAAMLLTRHERELLPDLFEEGVLSIQWDVGAATASVVDVGKELFEVEVPEESVNTLTNEEAQAAFDDFWEYYSTLEVPEGTWQVVVTRGNIQFMDEQGGWLAGNTYGDFPTNVSSIGFRVDEMTADVFWHDNTKFEVDKPVEG